MADKVADFYGLLGMRVDDGSFAKANKILSTVKKAVAAFIGFEITKSVVGAIDDVVQLGGALNDASQKTGVAAETLQEYTFGAGLAGVASEGLVSSLGKLNKGLAEAAATGKGPVADGLKAIGIGLNDPAVKAQNLDEILLEVSDKFQKMPDGPKKVAAAMDLFGKAGADLIPFLNQGGDGIERMKKEARELGVVIDNDTVSSLDDFGDDLDRVKAGWQGVKNQAVAAIIPLLKELMPALIATMKDIVAWVKEHKLEIQAFVFAVGKTIKTVVQAIVAVFKATVQAFKIMGTAIGQAIGWIVTKAIAIGSAFADAWAAVKSAATSAWNWLVGVGTGITETFISVGQGIIQAFKDAFDWVINKAKEVGSTIGNLPVIKQLGQIGRKIGGALAGDGGTDAQDQKDRDDLAKQGKLKPGSGADGLETVDEFQKRINAPASASPTPSVPPAGATSQTGASVQSTVAITVNPSPGMDERKLAEHIREVVDENMSNVFRHALANEGAPT